MRRLIIGFCVLLVAGCGSIPVDERAGRRADIDAVAAQTIEKLVAQNPTVQSELDDAVGYMVARLSAVNAPIFGGGSGLGVHVNNLERTRTYVNVSRFDASAAIGAQTFAVLVIFQDKAVMESFRQGRWQTAVVADAVAGTTGSTTVGAQQDGFTFRVLTEGGLVAGVNARLIRVTVNHDLTDTGISEISIPNRGFDIADAQEEGPRQWNRKLPFMAQRVVDAGYDLPLPLGTGVTYAYTDQEQLLDRLEVGFGGSGETTEVGFVSFSNASSKSNSTQAKFDFWLFPFMNVFGSIGKVTGKAPLQFTVDGNGWIEDLEDAGVIDCTPSSRPPNLPPNPVICGALEDRVVTVPIEANFDGMTYGIGTVLAGGWQGWFVSVPIVFTYSDMDDNTTEGIVTTVAPRGGRVVGLGRYGNLAFYAGGQYLKTELDVSGTFEFGDTGLAVDYKIRQQNKDRWATTFGGNWSINKHWSWTLEYSGFTGSRDNVVTSVSLRF